ncbi:MAG: COX15/CtaA family protein [Pedosphaera parvula]|nr:COX15/CtaA family protein [Pedosphaera parvula]
MTLLGVAMLASGRVKWDNGAFLSATGAVAIAVSFFWPSAQPAEIWQRRLGLAALVLVIVQGVLGGVRVVAVKNEIGILHGMAAQLFFALICVIALVTSPWWRGLGSERAAGVPRAWRLLFLGTTALILLQLVLGATMRHQHAGLAIPDFPLAYGKLWPATDAASLELVNQSRLDVRDFGPVTAFQVHLHMLHRLLAVAILLAVSFCATRCWRGHGARSLCAKLSMLWLGLILAQAVLGALTVLQNKPADIATLHVMVGAACLAVGSLVTVLVFRWSLVPAKAGLLPARERAETASVPGARGAMSAA